MFGVLPFRLLYRVHLRRLRCRLQRRLRCRLQRRLRAVSTSAPAAKSAPAPAAVSTPAPAAMSAPAPAAVSTPAPAAVSIPSAPAVSAKTSGLALATQAKRQSYSQSQLLRREFLKKRRTIIASTVAALPCINNMSLSELYLDTGPNY